MFDYPERLDALPQVVHVLTELTCKDAAVVFLLGVLAIAYTISLYPRRYQGADQRRDEQKHAIDQRNDCPEHEQPTPVADLEVDGGAEHESAYELLQRGEIVALLADRVDGSGASLASSFLGKPASFPLGPHLLAARAGVPVILCFGLYEGGANYRIEFAEFGPPAPADSRRTMLQPAVDRYASLLEQAAKRHPKNWFNFYPYWTRQ